MGIDWDTAGKNSVLYWNRNHDDPFFYLMAEKANPPRPPLASIISSDYWLDHLKLKLPIFFFIIFLKEFILTKQKLQERY